MKDLLNKKITLSKKGTDGKYQTFAWIEKSEKYPDTVSCSISVERVKALLENTQGKYLYCSVFVDSAEKKEEPAKTVEETPTVADTIPF